VVDPGSLGDRCEARPIGVLRPNPGRLEHAVDERVQCLVVGGAIETRRGRSPVDRHPEEDVADGLGDVLVNEAVSEPG
jgi:hypothetical protein